jgi:alkanesulfonate monooxygenase SsuD/methylene tetrahydromethanopterin reductase-like flavin-dependent oxidoreductase (luciferase family)
MRPFRFLATVDEYPGFAELTSLARKAEAIGCSTFVLPDHLIGQYAAMPLLAVVAAASERLRVGTFVLNVCLRHPAVLAQDLATLDVLSGGRLEIGSSAASRTWRASSRTCASASASAHSSSTTWTRWRQWWRNSPDSEARPPTASSGVSRLAASDALSVRASTFR